MEEQGNWFEGEDETRAGLATGGSRQRVRVMRLLERASGEVLFARAGELALFSGLQGRPFAWKTKHETKLLGFAGETSERAEHAWGLWLHGWPGLKENWSWATRFQGPLVSLALLAVGSR